MFASRFVIPRRSPKNPPNCHSEPTGEESRFAQVYFVLSEILRFAQDDKFGFVGQTHSISCVGVGEIPLLGEMSRSDKGVMAQP